MSEKGYESIERVGYYNEDYHLLQATKLEPLYRQIRNQMTAARIPVEFSKGEAAPSQHEVNIRYDEVLESADRSVLFKHGAKEIAWLNGYGLTFMAKPYAEWTGSSGHLHISLWDSSGEKPLFHDESGAKGAPYGMSQIMRWFLGGMMALQRELALFIAPNINSYKRYAVASWAPVNVVWGRDNRTTGFRIVGSGSSLHIENRFPGGDMNAYLAYAAEVGAGLYGIEHKIEPPAEFHGNGYEAKGCDRMPRALYEAVGLLEKSKAAVEILGRDVVDHYLNAARVERDAYDAAVHAWDRERYLERG
jgi:glutamine synthetase